MNRKQRRALRRQQQQRQTPGFDGQRPDILPPLDRGLLDAAKVALVPDWQFVHVLLAGCGGTGAYMAQHLGRLIRVLYDVGKGVHFTLVDPDIVQPENIGRQLFCDAELGQPKAEALMRRYGQAWGLNCSVHVGDYEDSLLYDAADVTLLVGCVDKAQGRRALHETLRQNDGPLDPAIWWLDCGNAADMGRVLLGSAHSAEQMRGSFMDGFCRALPSPALQSPGLLEAQPEESGELSCAEAAIAGLQSLNINARIAAEAADFAARLLLTHDLKRFACEINLAAGSTKSRYCTPEEIAPTIRRGPDFLKLAQPNQEPRPIISTADMMEDLAEMGVTI